MYLGRTRPLYVTGFITPKYSETFMRQRELRLDPGRGRRPEQLEVDAILEKSVEDGLRQILGQSGLEMVRNLYPLRRISDDPAVLHEALKDIFMASGASIIEREVARRFLEAAGNEMTAEGRPRFMWLAAAASKGKSPGHVSKREKEVLRQFLTLESLARGGRADGKPEPTPIEITVTNFAYAFKKGI